METRIFIDKDSHSYVKSGMTYTPVSTILNHYKQPFNREYWSWRKGYENYLLFVNANDYVKLSEEGAKKAVKNKVRDQITSYLIRANSPRYQIEVENLDLLHDTITTVQQITLAELEPYRQEILDQWDGKRDTASLKGNTYHRGREFGAIKNGFEVNAFDNKEYTVHNELLLNAYPESNDPTFEVSEELLWNMDFADKKYAISNNYYEDLPDGFYPELLIWNDKYKVGGTADRIFFESNRGIGTRLVDVDDYKTNTVIDKKSFYQRGKGYKMMQAPLNHLMDCKHTHYHLQVSLYAYMLEEMGFEVRKIGYHHLNFLNVLPYLRDEAIMMLEDYSKRGKSPLELNNQI